MPFLLTRDSNFRSCQCLKKMVGRSLSTTFQQKDEVVQFHYYFLKIRFLEFAMLGLPTY